MILLIRTSELSHDAQLDSDEFTPHVLRHTLGRELIDKAVDPFMVQALIGHKRIDSNALYNKPSKDDLEVAVAKLEVEEQTFKRN